MIKLLVALLTIATLTTQAHARGWSWFDQHRPRIACATGRSMVISRYCVGHHTASGEHLNCKALTAAAPRSIPLNTRIRIVNPRNGRSVTVRVNDRVDQILERRFGLDLTPAAFAALGPLGPDGRRESGWGCVHF